MTKDVERYRKIFDSLDPSDDNYIDNFIKAISQVLIERDIFVKNSVNNDKRVEFYELLRNQLIRLNARKIEFIGCGHSSLAFRIGDIVVKIGKSETNEKKIRFRLLDTTIC